MANLPKNEEIRLAINSYCVSKGISKNELAVQTGVSGATLSKIENGKWDDIDQRLWRKIWNKVSDVISNEHLTTNDFTDCHSACEYAKKNHLMIGLIGDTGVGKTTALNAFSMRSKNVFYVAYEKTMSPKYFFQALLKEMGIPFEGNIHQMVARVSQEINSLANPLIIIDEAGKITHTMILYLHVLRDKTIKNCGVVLAGMPYFKNNLLKLSNKQKEGYAEFYRRINLWQELKGLHKNEIHEICKLKGITEPSKIDELRSKKRFGDLNNAILLYKLQLNEHE